MMFPYFVLHLAVIGLCSALSYLAFMALTPPYLIVAFAGYFFWQRMVRAAPARRIARAAAVGVTQALVFFPLAIAEFKLIGAPMDSKEGWTVIAYLGALALAGYVFVAVVFVAFYPRTASPS